jgi:hypothetical protein
MSDESLIKLLTMTHGQNQKYEIAMEAGIDLEKVVVDLLPIVLDEIGMPPSNYTEQSAKYGENASEHPDTFVRDWCEYEFKEIVVEGTEDEARAYLAAMRGEIAKMQAAKSQVPLRNAEPKIGRNAPCHCGSGMKFKHCHGKTSH